jgi:WS/DGAT/MGAT family acyltransferase
VGDPTYERLAAQDSSFVRFEDEGVPVHISAVARFEARSEPFYVDEVRARIASRLHAMPHSRQRLDFTPGARAPVWIDDDRFDLRAHVRGVGLPRPGREDQLRELAEHLISQPLDMRRPLWELVFVEGAHDRTPVVVAKVHHSMVDGVSGIGVLLALLDLRPDAPPQPAPEWRPRKAPTRTDYLWDGTRETARLGWSALGSLGATLRSPLQAASSLLDTASAGFETLRAGLVPPGDTPFNRPIGSRRRVDWRSFDLAVLRDVRKRLDGSINDVVLTVVAGALRSFLRRRRAKLSGLDLRCVVPVDTRTGEEREGVGNRVSAWFVGLPVSMRSPRSRFARIREQTRRLKDSGAEQSIDGFLRFADFTGLTQLTFLGVNLVNWIRPYNLIVTNVHGPHFPLYFMGSQLQSFTPHLPLFPDQGLSIAALSYQGRIHVGLTADRDLVPDLHVLGEDLEESFAELRRAAETGGPG